MLAPEFFALFPSFNDELLSKSIVTAKTATKQPTLAPPTSILFPIGSLPPKKRSTDKNGDSTVGRVAVNCVNYKV